MSGHRSGGGPSQQDDAQLLLRLQAGDDRALGAVYAVHSAMVFGVARRVTCNEELARDVCQEVFTYLWEQPDRVDLSRGSLRGYLAMVAHRRAVDEVRRSERRAKAQAALTVPDQTDGPELEVVEASSARWRDERLTAVLDALPEDQRRALTLAYFDGLTYRQVAQALGIPEGTAKSRLRLGLLRLRALLGADFRTAVLDG